MDVDVRNNDHDHTYQTAYSRLNDLCQHHPYQAFGSEYFDTENTIPMKLRKI
jgi:hypothetical protein